MIIERDGKAYALTDAEMMEAYWCVRENQIEQEFLLRYSDPDTIKDLAKICFLSSSEREILTNVLFVPNSAFMRSLFSNVAEWEKWETYTDSYSDMLHHILEDNIRSYFNAYRKSLQTQMLSPDAEKEA